MTGALPSAPVRHVLVIATQCPAAEQHLSGLETTAEELYRVLTDPAIGACVPSDPDGGAALRSGAVGQPQIEAAVQEAARRAGAAGAVLILVFIGHGQTPQGSSTLYYMAHNTGVEEASSSVRIGKLLTDATEQRGIKGVIALIDTCHAGAGAPDTDSLAGGFSMGNNSLSLLMSVAAHQRAYDLSFSRELVALLRRGIPGKGELLRAATLKLALTDELLRQNCQVLDRDGDPDAVEELWVAFNEQRPTWRPGSPLGEIGAKDLAEALAAWPAPQVPPEGWDRTALRDLHDKAAASEADEALWVRQVADGLLMARDTTEMIHDWAGHALTTPALWSAIADLNSAPGHGGPRPETVRPPRSLEGGGLLRYLVEHAALRIPARGNPVARLARTVVAIAGQCGLSTDDERVLAWARRVDGGIELADAARRQAERHGDRALRLVISLHAARFDWPDSLSVWLRDGSRCEHHEQFPCEPTRAGVERRLPDILNWARHKAPGRAPIGHIDIVVPAPLLLTWEPEKALIGPYRLGAHHTVVLRWAGRLAVPGYLGDMNGRDRQRLERLNERNSGTGAPVDWLAASETHDMSSLAERVSTGRYGRAIGLGHRPPHVAELVELLLACTPILLWPRVDRDLDGQGRTCLDEWWDHLPDRFIDAYRQRWYAETGLPADVSDQRDDRVGLPPALADLADLRAAWHDIDWLDFCRWFEQNTPTNQWSA